MGRHRSIAWSLAYLGISSSLIGVLGAIGPGFAVGTGTLVSPTTVVLGPLPAFLFGWSELTVIRAPQNGRIVRRYANPGAGASTVVFAAAGESEKEASVTSSA